MFYLTGNHGLTLKRNKKNCIKDVHKLTGCVPVVKAVSPRQFKDVDDRRPQIEQRPRDDHVVVDTH